MIEPIRISFEVACPVEHAFRTYTERATLWFPVEHTMTKEAGLAVVFEPRPGGRIFERTPDGTEADWGTITAWEPPVRLVYAWFIATERADATEVEIRFLAAPGDRTRVEIEHRGWERLAERGPAWRGANVAGWDAVLPGYIALTEGPSGA